MRGAVTSGTGQVAMGRKGEVIRLKIKQKMRKFVAVFWLKKVKI